MRVPYNYLPMQFADPRSIIRDWEELIFSTEFTLGPVMEAFEEKFAQFVGMHHCIATNNGTDALTLAFKSIGLCEGDEAITVCNTFYATVGAIVCCGATPVFVDSDDRFQIDVSKIEQAITKRTKVIVPVHWAGASPDMNAIVEIAARTGLTVVEDACMGIGSLRKPWVLRGSLFRGGFGWSCHDRFKDAGRSRYLCSNFDLCSNFAARVRSPPIALDCISMHPPVKGPRVIAIKKGF